MKELLLDLQRRATDRWRNLRVCTIIDGRRPQLRMVHWENLRVGNIVRLTDEEEVPADVVVLATSNPEGIAYVETSKLDGETTLKFKQGVKETRTETYPLAIAGIRGRVVCEKPTYSMENFSGSLKLDAHPRATSLDLSNFIHRGSHIRNTEWVYGVVVYTGHDTRSLRSAKHPSLKFAHIESEMNSYTLVSFFIIALLILIAVMSKSSIQVGFSVCLYLRVFVYLCICGISAQRLQLLDECDQLITVLMFTFFLLDEACGSYWIG